MPNNGNLKPWKPGQSGNPAGHSRGRRVTDALIRLIDEKGADKALAARWLQEALKGDPKFFSMLLERVEGKVPEPKPDDAPTDAPAIQEFLDAGIKTDPNPKGKSKKAR